MIEFEQVSKSYDGNEVIHSISLQIPDRHTFVLLGKSGSGKTTTLKMINRLIEMDSGTITINNRSIQEQPKFQLRRSIGYVIQHIGLFPHMRVDENIATVPRLLGWDKSRIVERIDYLAKILSLDQDLLGRYPSELSGGQQQRVGLARALATDPDVILMDEPFGALDPITRNDIQHLFLTMEEMMHKTVVMVTHDVKEAFKLGDQICLMEDGNILQVGTPGELLFNPVNESVDEFFQSIRPELEQDVLTLQDLYLHLNQENFEFNRYPFPPSLSVSALMRNLEMVDAPIPEREKVFRAFEKIKRDKQNRKSS